MEEQITIQQSPMGEKPQKAKKKIKHKGLIIAGSVVAWNYARIKARTSQSSCIG